MNLRELSEMARGMLSDEDDYWNEQWLKHKAERPWNGAAIQEEKMEREKSKISEQGAQRPCTLDDFFALKEGAILHQLEKFGKFGRKLTVGEPAMSMHDGVGFKCMEGGVFTRRNICHYSFDPPKEAKTWENGEWRAQLKGSELDIDRSRSHVVHYEREQISELLDSLKEYYEADPFTLFGYKVADRSLRIGCQTVDAASLESFYTWLNRNIKEV